METNTPRDATVGELLSRLGDIENYPDEHLAPYQEFRFATNTYYFTPGGLLYRKDPGSEEVGASFVTISPTRSGTIAPTTVSKILLHQLKGSELPERLIDLLEGSARRQARG